MPNVEDAIDCFKVIINYMILNCQAIFGSKGNGLGSTHGWCTEDYEIGFKKTQR